jgi:hypothetical protein
MIPSKYYLRSYAPVMKNRYGSLRPNLVVLVADLDYPCDRITALYGPIPTLPPNGIPSLPG